MWKIISFLSHKQIKLNYQQKIKLYIHKIETYSVYFFDHDDS